VPSLKGFEESLEVRGAFALGNFKDAVTLELAEGGGEPAALVEGVFIDAEHLGAHARETLTGLAPGELMVDALDGGGSDLSEFGDARSTDAIVVVAVDALSERLGGVPSGQDARQRLHKALGALQAAKAPATDRECGILTESFEVTDAPEVSALAVEAVAPAARAGHGPVFERFYEKFHRWLALIPQNSVSLDSYLTRWGHGAHCSSMTLCPQTLMKSPLSQFQEFREGWPAVTCYAGAIPASNPSSLSCALQSSGSGAIRSCT